MTVAVPLRRTRWWTMSVSAVSTTSSLTLGVDFDYVYSTETTTNVTATFLADDVGVELNLWSLLLLVFPVATAFGNALVCASVWTERSLQTVTNYFIVSLAVADLMVAVLVMPLAVYVEVSRSLLSTSLKERNYSQCTLCFKKQQQPLWRLWNLDRFAVFHSYKKNKIYCKNVQYFPLH